MLTFFRRKKFQAVLALLALTLALAFVVLLPMTSAAPISDAADGGAPTNAKVSDRLIVQLTSPSLSELAAGELDRTADGRINLQSASARNHLAQLQAEQAAFIAQMNKALPTASVSTYMNESGRAVEATYQLLFNGVAVDPGATDTAAARRILSKLPGVRAVYLDYAHYPQTYASMPLINAPALWDALGGQDNAGDGVKIASMDGGLHHDAAMFDGTGFSYPAGAPFNGSGLGDMANNNGKIIASRAYFRSWDPPAPGDENTWPGQAGTSHGTHTGSTAGGNAVVADYLGITETVSGVAPGAWLMSYRVFYESVTSDGSFYTVEGIAALEDIMADGADVVNNSWGGGPGSAGGEFDPLDTALINLANSGVFVSMSAGNAGPGKGTTDHPSSNYINVAASTTDGTYAAGELNVIEPTPPSPDLQDLSFLSANFGPPLPLGQVLTYSFVTAASVDPANFEGCNEWEGTPFAGKAAVISRGSCEFGLKVLNAENGGAEFVIVHNHATGGEALVSMSPGEVGDQVTISSIFIGHTDGLAMVDWYATHGDASVLQLSTIAKQVGNIPDQIVGFSSRGPGVGNVLKPDIAAPGVNILAQGYGQGSGEARHLGFGQVSGTSMAAPHVAGSAALLKQMHPTWTPADIKSALMSTAKYTDVYNFDGTPAQPLDMGAGRLDLTNAADPGVILDPPSLSFGTVMTGTSKSIDVVVTSVATQTETYELSTLYTGGGFTDTTALPGFTVTPVSVTLGAGGTETVTVAFDSTMGMGMGDNQGYIVMDGTNYDAHMPAWARVLPPPSDDVLIIVNDGASSLGFPSYLSYYTEALSELGLTYEVWDADANFANPATIPDASTLSQYKAIIYYTGDNFYPDGAFTVSTALTELDMNRLTEYANMGGIIIAMGQDMSAVLASDETDEAEFFYGSVLGGNWFQDSVTGFDLPEEPIVPLADAPAAFTNMLLDLSMADTYAGEVALSPDNEVLFYLYMPLAANSGAPAARSPMSPAATSDTTGVADIAFDDGANRLDYSVALSVTEPVTITAAHIHQGGPDENGPVLYPIFSGPVVVTDTLAFDGTLIISEAHADLLVDGQLYINFHSMRNPRGETRGQIVVETTNDGANNQYYIDELDPEPNLEPDGFAGKAYPYMPLLKYPGTFNMEEGVVAVAHREQPSLELPGISYYGRSIYTSFGLEGVNDTTTGATTRAELLAAFMNWAMDEPQVEIMDVTSSYSETTQVMVFEATVTSNITGTTGVSYRWDYGDGSDIDGPYESNTVSHAYACGNTYTLRVEATDSWGNRALDSLEVTTPPCPTQ